MKKIIFAILLILSIFSFAQTRYKYLPARSTGTTIVTDYALNVSEFLQLPYANAANPSIYPYVDSSGRIMYNRYDSTLIVRHNGSWLKFFNSTKINSMDAAVVHLLGAETITGAKTFNGNVTSAGITTVGNDIVWSNNTGYGLKGSDGIRFFSYTPSGGIQIASGIVGFTVGANTIFNGTVTTNSTLTVSGATTSNDITWSNNTGFGLKGSDGVRFISYTTAGGVALTPIALATIKKIKGGSSAPTISVNGVSGTSASITGTDLAGEITFTTSNGSISAGTILTVTFSSAYTSTAPFIVFSSSNDKSPNAAQYIYVTNRSTSGFDLAFNATYTVFGTTYKWTYQVIQ